MHELTHAALVSPLDKVSITHAQTHTVNISFNAPALIIQQGLISLSRQNCMCDITNS